MRPQSDVVEQLEPTLVERPGTVNLVHPAVAVEAQQLGLGGLGQVQRAERAERADGSGFFLHVSILACFGCCVKGLVGGLATGPRTELSLPFPTL
jgi:hypothetical protein